MAVVLQGHRAALLDALESLVQAILELVGQPGAVVQTEDVFLLELLLIELAHRGVVLDALIHEGLGERRLVAFVVSVPAVAQQVDDGVAPELLAEAEGKVDDVADRLRVVAVDVEDGRLDELGDVGRVAGGARLARQRREADLVVDHDVDRAAGAIPLELRQVEGLRHQALAGKRRVAVDQERQHLLAELRVVAPPLLGARAALHHGVHRLEVAGVGGEADVDGRAVLGDVVGGVPTVILDVAVTSHRIGGDVVLELVEYGLVRLVQDVGEHVQPPAMGHPQHDVFGTGLGGGLHELVEGGNQRFGPLQGEPLLTLVAAVGEGLEQLGVDELGEDPDLALRGELGLVANGFHLLLQPAPDGSLLDVQVLHADVAAVGVAQDLQDLAQGDPLRAAEVAGVENHVEVLGAEVEGLQLELGVSCRALLDGVGPRDQVADAPIGEDQAGHPRLGGGALAGHAVARAHGEVETREEETPLL